MSDVSAKMPGRPSSFTGLKGSCPLALAACNAPRVGKYSTLQMASLSMNGPYCRSSTSLTKLREASLVLMARSGD